jgi:hypothetical protein
MTKGWPKEIFELIFQFVHVAYIPLLYETHVQFTYFKPPPEQMVELIQILLKGCKSRKYTPYREDHFHDIARSLYHDFPKIFQLLSKDPEYARCGGILLTKSKKAQALEDPKIIKNKYISNGIASYISQNEILLLCCHPCLTLDEHEISLENAMEKNNWDDISLLLCEGQLQFRSKLAAKIIQLISTKLRKSNDRSILSNLFKRFVISLVEDKRFHPVITGVNFKSLYNYIHCLQYLGRKHQIDALLDHKEIELDKNYLKEIFKHEYALDEETLYYVLTHPKTKLYKGFCADLPAKNIRMLFNAMFWSSYGPRRQDPSIFDNEALEFVFEKKMYLECERLLEDERVNPNIPAHNEFLHLSIINGWTRIRQLLQIHRDTFRERKKVKA